VSHEVRMIASPASATGFRLAGLVPLEAADGEAAARALSDLLIDPKIGVVLVEDRLHRALPDPVRRQLAARALPMVVPYPAPRWARPVEDREAFIAELLQRAIGYRVKLG
jgi:V/A-type H+-transporting ATPase subunit F